MNPQGKKYSPEERAELERLFRQLFKTFALVSQKEARALDEICEEQPRPSLKCAYLPLWDTRKNALTTYLCLPPAPPRRLSRYGRASMDMDMLGAVMTELEAQGRAGKKFFIVCPVRHETLYNRDSYKKYHMLCRKLPSSQKKFFIPLITHLQKDLPKTQAYWFLVALRKYCQQVFCEVPMGQKTDFLLLRNAGIDALGVRLGGGEGSEQETIRLLNGFGAQAKTARIPVLFVMDVPSLSLATSAVCAGFDYLGGVAIHGAVEKPDNIYRYHHEDLFGGLLRREIP